MHWELTPNGSTGNTLALPSFPAGLLYGYGVYTTFALPLADEWLNAHLERLAQQANAIGLAWPFPPNTLVQRLHQHYQPEYPIGRLTAIPDVSGYGDFYQSASPLNTRLILSVRKASPPVENLTLKTVPYQRPFATLKLNAMADVILLKRQARTAGFDEVLLINNRGHISEASTANVFFIDQGILLTPQPELDHCLPGITRLRVLKTAHNLGIPYREQSIPVEAIPGMDGAFLTNAAQGIMPIAQMDQHRFPWPHAAHHLLQRLQASSP